MTFEVMKVRWNLIEPLGVHLADVGQPSMPVVASEASTYYTLP